ncbi:restriction endonuclease subunit S [Ileibacterium valens]|uniref:restriction endonuclease subunit S n=1 Tax=Ileibacterium valens TaxID=1862668 RepID=UPI002573B43D|nr:restriction endonuclease subunit S [Ileibacterium valens]
MKYRISTSLLNQSKSFKSRFIEMFGDPLTNPNNFEIAEIREACRKIIGGGTPSKHHPEYYDGTIPWVTPKDMKSKKIMDSIDHISVDAVNNSSAKNVPRNSVLMVIRSGILKHTLPVAVNDVEVTINQDMKAFIPSEKILPLFLCNYFKMIEKDVLSGVRGVTADNIDFKEFQKRKIIIPPVKLQEEFSHFYELIDKSKLAIQQSIDQLETLKKKLMQEYFG